MSDRLRIVETLTLIRDCLCASLAGVGRPVATCYTSWGTPGGFGIGNGCDGGCEYLAIWVNELGPVNPQTGEPVRAGFCGPTQLAVTFQVALVRCFPTLTETGQLPSADLVEAAADTGAVDLAALWDGVRCCPSDLDVVVESLAPESSPEGGQSVIALTGTVLLPAVGH